MNTTNKILKDVINIYDNNNHPNTKCQNIKDEWTKYCFYTKKGKHEKFVFYKGSQICNQLFNDYYECFVNDIINHETK
jgi:hypothetical protein